MTDRETILDWLRKKAEAIPAEERDWYTLDQPWLGRDMETMILSGNPDPHVGVMVCDFQDASIAGVEDRYEDEDWTARNWAMAEYIAAADPNTVLSLIKEISELREALDCEQTADKDLCWMIWSNEHRAWWRPESCGYTRKIGDAGLYSYEEAKSICFPPHFRGTADAWPPPEIMVASWGTELLDITKEHFQ